jgi:hypothetical protein
MPALRADAASVGFDIQALFRDNPRLMHKLAGELCIHATSIRTWTAVPPNRLAAVSRALGIPAAVLRPDIAAAFQPAPAENNSAEAA